MRESNAPAIELIHFGGRPDGEEVRAKLERVPASLSLSPERLKEKAEALLEAPR